MASAAPAGGAVGASPPLKGRLTRVAVGLVVARTLP